jgi:hypothetical protein
VYYCNVSQIVSALHGSSFFNIYLCLLPCSDSFPSHSTMILQRLYGCACTAYTCRDIHQSKQQLGILWKETEIMVFLRLLLTFVTAYTSMFPSMQLFIFLQSFHSLSRHVLAPIDHHQVLLFAKTVNCSNNNCSYSYVFYYLCFTETTLLLHLLKVP